MVETRLNRQMLFRRLLEDFAGANQIAVTDALQDAEETDFVLASKAGLVCTVNVKHGLMEPEGELMMLARNTAQEALAVLKE